MIATGEIWHKDDPDNYRALVGFKLKANPLIQVYADLLAQEIKVAIDWRDRYKPHQLSADPPVYYWAE